MIQQAELDFTPALVAGRAATHLVTPSLRSGILKTYATHRDSITFYVAQAPGGSLLTWSGRGLKPAWVREWLDNSGHLDDLAITITKETKQ